MGDANGRGTLRRVAVWGALAVILAVTGWLRTQRLAEVAYWFDESFCVKMIEYSVAEIWARSAHDTHPPFFFLLLKGWAVVFGTSPTGLRMLSVSLGLVAVLGVFLFVREAYGEDDGRKARRADVPALAAAALLGLSPFHIAWSVQVRMYALATALAATTCWLLMRALRRPPARRLDWLLFTACAVLLAYTHHFGVIMLVAEYTFAIGYLLFHPARRAAEKSRWRVTPAVLSGLCVALLWQFWLPAVLDQRQRVVANFWSKPITWDWLGTMLYQLFGVHQWAPPSPQAGLYIGQAIVGGLVVLQLGRRAADALVGLAAGLPLAVALGVSVLSRNIFVSHYLIIALEFMLIAAAVLLWRVRPRVLGGVLLAAAVAGMGFRAAQHYEFRERMASHPGMQAAAARLDEGRGEKEPLIVCNPMLYTSVVAYSQRRGEAFTYGSNDQYPFFHGTAVMGDEDYLPASRLTDGTYEWVWTLDANHWMGESWNVPLPAGWQEVADTKIPEYYCELVIRLYRRDRSADAARIDQRPVGSGLPGGPGGLPSG